MKLSCLQEEMKRLYYERDARRGVFATFAWLVEEVGELGEAILKGDKRQIGEEIADVIAWVLSLANILGIDVVKAFKSKYPDVKCSG